MSEGPNGLIKQWCTSEERQPLSFIGGGGCFFPGEIQPMAQLADIETEVIPTQSLGVSLDEEEETDDGVSVQEPGHEGGGPSLVMAAGNPNWAPGFPPGTAFLKTKTCEVGEGTTPLEPGEPALDIGCSPEEEDEAQHPRPGKATGSSPGIPGFLTCPGRLGAWAGTRESCQSQVERFVGLMNGCWTRFCECTACSISCKATI